MNSLSETLSNVMQDWITKDFCVTITRNKISKMVWLVRHSNWKSSYENGKAYLQIENQIREMLVKAELWIFSPNDDILIEPVEFISMKDIVSGGHRTQVFQMV